MHLPRLLVLLFLAGCATASSVVPEGWRSVPAAAVPSLAAAPHPTEGVSVVANQLFQGATTLTPRFAAIDSFDVSLERREVIFSAKRTKSFDIGLISLDGSEIHWVPEDVNDEVAVQWAPRGNKASYIVHIGGGDIVRTVHIPTATQLSVDFPNAAVRALRWDADGERYAVVVESPDASPRVESMRFGGEGRRTDTPPQVRLDVAIEPFGRGLLMRPAALRYGQRLPLVVWVAPSLYAWNDARGALLRDARLACAIVTGPPDAAFWRAVRDVQWIDPVKLFLVDGGGAGAPAAADEPAGLVRIEADAALAPDRWVRRGNHVLVAPALVQSVAAGYITAEVKGTPRTNGR